MTEITYIKKMVGNWLTKKPSAFALPGVLFFIFLFVLTSLIFWNYENAYDLAVASRSSVWVKAQYWRLWSSLFVHADLGHLLANSFFFGIFAYFLLGHFGFWVFPVFAFLFGGLTNFIVLRSMELNTELMGASGVVYWMGGSWIALHFFLERRGENWKRWIRAIGVAVILFVPETLEPQVSYLSHFVGFILGILWASIYYLVNRSYFLSQEEWQTVIDPTHVIASSLAEEGSLDPPEYWKEIPPEAK